MLETIGYIGAACFALSAVPQAYKSFKEGHSKGVSWGLLILWSLGEICLLIYTLPKQDYPLIVNYVSNLILLIVILKYKFKPRNKA